MTEATCDYAWLNKVTNQIYEQTAEPFSFSVNGQPYFGASDGIVFVAIEGASAFKPISNAKMLQSVGKWFVPKTSKPVGVVPFAEMRDWIDVSMVGKCQYCGGTGLEPEWYDPDYDVPADVRLGLFFGREINREILAVPFKFLSAEKVSVYLAGEKEPILLVADGWQIAAMGMMPREQQRGIVPPLSELSRFPVREEVATCD